MEDRDLKLPSGFAALAGVLLGLILLVMVINLAVVRDWPWLLWLIVPGFLAWLVSLFGFIINGPNQARVVQLFGKYVGTIKDVGFFYGNPFYVRRRVSLRVRTLETGGPPRSSASRSRSTTRTARLSRFPPWWCGRW